jgi:hypothetical protein
MREEQAGHVVGAGRRGKGIEEGERGFGDFGGEGVEEGGRVEEDELVGAVLYEAGCAGVVGEALFEAVETVKGDAVAETNVVVAGDDGDLADVVLRREHAPEAGILAFPSTTLDPIPQPPKSKEGVLKH